MSYPIIVTPRRAGPWRAQTILFAHPLPSGFAHHSIVLRHVDTNKIVPSSVQILRAHDDGSIRLARIAAWCEKPGIYFVEPSLVYDSDDGPPAPPFPPNGLILRLRVGDTANDRGWSAKRILEESASSKTGPLLSERVFSSWLFGVRVSLLLRALYPRTFMLEATLSRETHPRGPDVYLSLGEDVLFKGEIFPGQRIPIRRFFGERPDFHVSFHPEAFALAGAILPVMGKSMPDWKRDQWETDFDTSAKQPGEKGVLTPYMKQSGGREELGLVTGWAAADLAGGNDPFLRRLHLDTAFRSGNFPIHFEIPEDTSRFRINPGEGCLFVPDSQHVPAYAYLAYLMTGEPWLGKEIDAWAHYAIFSRDPQKRGEKGSLVGDAVRAEAWTFRNVAMAEVYGPTASMTKTSSSSIQETLRHWDLYIQGSTIEGRGPHPLGCYRPQSWFKWNEAKFFESGVTHTASPWNQDFLIIVLSWMRHLVLACGRNGAAVAILNRILDHLVSWRVGLLTSFPGFDARDACPGTLAVTKGGVDLATFEEVWKASFANRPATILPGSWTSWRGADAYAGYARAALAASREAVQRVDAPSDLKRRHEVAIDWITTRMKGAGWQPSHAPQWAIK